MSGPGWLFAVACMSPFAALPALALCWRAELAARVWLLRLLDKDLKTL